MTTKIITEEIYKEAKKVPLLSPCVSQLLHLTAINDHELSDVINLVKHDAALTSQILKVANSVTFSAVNTISSIDRAIIYLGERMVVTIALMDVASYLFDKNLDGYQGEKSDLWKHDLRTAIASREIARETNMDINPEMAFTAGLLHDIGKAVISDYLIDIYPYLMEKIKQHFVRDFLEGERELLGTDHAQIGHQVAKSWNLPGSLETSIRYHHEPSNAPKAYQPLVYTVHIGDVLAMLNGWGTGVDNLQYHLDSGYIDYFDFSIDQVESIVLKIDEEYSKIESSIEEIK